MATEELEPVALTPHKHDPAWKHCQTFKNGDKMQLKCLYCHKMFKGGGIHRFKEHLACRKGNASACLGVPTDVRDSMQQSLDGVVVRRRKKPKIVEAITSISPPPGGVDGLATSPDLNNAIQILRVPNNGVEPISSFMANQEEEMDKKSVEKRKRGRPRKSCVTSEPVAVNGSIGVGLKKVNHQVHMAVGKFFYDVGLSLDAVNSAYFRPMVDAIASQGPGVVAPSYHDLRGWVLKKSLEEVNSERDRYMGTWGRTGCSVLVDQWNTDKGRTLINFWVYCPEATIFLKSVDVTDMVNSMDALCKLLREVVEEVGVKHVLQVITNGEERYIAAGKRLADVFPTLYWNGCSAQSIDLMLEDFGKIEWISEILEDARSITRFVYNRGAVLNMMRRHTFGNDLVVPGVTRSITNFAMLKRMVDLKHNLQAMVTSQEWMDCPYSKKPGGLAMLECISSQSFWGSCARIIRLTDPLMRAFKIVGSERRPAMGYTYAAMYRAKETIKKELFKKEDYMPYWNIIDKWWRRQWRHPLYVAGFYLNPKFFYSMEEDMQNEFMSGMFDCIERLVSDINIQDKIIKEISSYKNAVGDFGRKMTIRARNTLHPAEWWSTYGGGCPNLARLAIRILSQTCSSFRCKRIQTPFDQRPTTGNCLERQRLSDLVFVEYNLHLRQTVQKNKEPDSMDPLSFDSIGVVEDWITEKEAWSKDIGSFDWTALDPPSGNTMLLGRSNDEVEDLGAGFDDFEIFKRVKDGEDDNVEDNEISQ